MSINDFDAENIAKDLAKQAKDVIPSDLTDEQQQYIINILYKFSVLAGNALNQESNIRLNSYQAHIVVQYISEWTFYKNIDLIRAYIPKENWEEILRNVAFAVFEKAKYCELNNMDRDKERILIEKEVNSSYEKSIEELIKNKKNKKSYLFKILTFSNRHNIQKDEDFNNPFHYIKFKLARIFNLRNKIKRQQNRFIDYIKSINSTQIKIIIVSLLGLSTLISINFTSNSDLINDLFHIYLNLVVGTVTLYWLKKMYIEKACKKSEAELNEIKQNIQDLVNPDKMLDRLTIDILQIRIGTDLLSIADPEQEGPLLSKLAALRQSMTDELGYIIPNVRTMDHAQLDKNEFAFIIRERCVDSGKVYPNRLMVIADKWDKKNYPIPDDVIEEYDSSYQAKVYWLTENQIKDKDIDVFEPTDIIITHLKDCCIKSADEIISLHYVSKLIDCVKKQSPVSIDILIPSLLSLVDLRKILVNLVREKISIKDLNFILDRLCDFARFSKDPDVLSEKIRITIDKKCQRAAGMEDI